MALKLSAEQVAFIEAHFKSDDAEAVVQEHIDRWINDMVDASYIPPAAETAAKQKQKMKDATAHILTERQARESRGGL